MPPTPQHPASARGPFVADRILDRALGCFLGLATGDALGTTLQGLAVDQLHPGALSADIDLINPRLVRWTSATAMALALADTLLDPHGYSSQGFMLRLRQWLEAGHFTPQGKCVGIGRTTLAAIRRFISTREVQSPPDPNAFAGSGSLVRLTPVALRLLHQPETAELVARQQSASTHAAPEAADACALFVAQLRQLILDEPKHSAFRQPPAVAHAQMSEVQGSWPFHERRPRPTGRVSNTLGIALWSLHQSRDFEGALMLATGVGGPSSAIGAVAGALAGAAYGLSSIPPRWLNRLAWKNRIRNIAYALLDTPSC